MARSPYPTQSSLGLSISEQADVGPTIDSAYTLPGFDRIMDERRRLMELTSKEKLASRAQREGAQSNMSVEPIERAPAGGVYDPEAAMSTYAPMPAPAGGVYDVAAGVSEPVLEEPRPISQQMPPRTMERASLSLRMPVMGAARVRGTGKPDYQASIDAARKGYEEAQAYQNVKRQEAEARLKEAADKIKEAEDLRGKFKFDPNRAMPTLGSKIAAGIAIALGEAARGFRGGQGPNVGLDLINQSVDREVERQKMEYARLGDRVSAAENLFTRNLQILNNEKAAEDKTREQILGIAAQKAGVLLEKAQQTEQNNRLQQNLAMQQAQLNMSALQAMQKEAESASQDFILKAVEARTGAEQMLNDVERAKNSVASMMGTDPEAIREGAEALTKTGFFGGEAGIAKIQRLINKALTTTDEQGRGSFIGELSNIIGTEISDSFAAANEFKNIINVLAFGMARAGQSASSISNRDVQMFVNVLADTARNPYRLYEYMEHLEQLSQIDAYMHNYMLTKRDDLGGKAPLQLDQTYIEALDAAKKKFGFNNELGVFETSFIKSLRRDNALEQMLQGTQLGKYRGV